MKKDRKRVDYLTQEDKDNAPVLFQDIKKIFAEKKVDKIFTNDLVKYLCVLPESRWTAYFGIHDVKNGGRYISKLLNTYGIHSLIMRIGRKRLRGYEIGHFEKLEPLSYDLLKWLQNDCGSCYVSWSEMHEGMKQWIVLKEEQILGIISDLEAHGWLKEVPAKMKISIGGYEKLWRIRSKSERDQDRRKKKTVEGISTAINNPDINPGMVCSKPLDNWKDWRTSGSFKETEPKFTNSYDPKTNINKIRIEKYIDTVRAGNQSASQKITEKFLPKLHQLCDEKRVNPATKHLDIDILVCQMLEQHNDALELEYRERLQAQRARHYNHTTILIMISALLGGFAFWVGTLVGG